jgi:hypothetical protein
MAEQIGKQWRDAAAVAVDLLRRSNVVPIFLAEN